MDNGGVVRNILLLHQLLTASGTTTTGHSKGSAGSRHDALFLGYL